MVATVIKFDCTPVHSRDSKHVQSTVAALQVDCALAIAPGPKITGTHHFTTVQTNCGKAAIFQGPLSFMSNYFPSTITGNEFQFLSAEHAYQHAKAVHFDDHDSALDIRKAPTAHRARQIGRQVRAFDKAEWDKHCIRAMVDVVWAKFSQNSRLAQALSSTGTTMPVEAGAYDQVWSCGLDRSDSRIMNVSAWTGGNLMGKILYFTRVRLAKLARDARQPRRALTAVQPKVGGVTTVCKMADFNALSPPLPPLLEPETQDTMMMQPARPDTPRPTATDFTLLMQEQILERERQQQLQQQHLLQLHSQQQQQHEFVVPTLPPHALQPSSMPAAESADPGPAPVQPRVIRPLTRNQWLMQPRGLFVLLCSQCHLNAKKGALSVDLEGQTITLTACFSCIQRNRFARFE